MKSLKTIILLLSITIFIPSIYAQQKGIMIIKPNLHLQNKGSVVKNQILLKRAQERFYQGLYEDAIRDLNNYIDQTGDKFGNAYYLRACCKVMTNEKDESALRDINEAINKQEKANVDTYFSLSKKGDILEGLGNDELTIHFFKEMVAIERNKPSNQFLLLKAAAYNSLSNLYRFNDLDLALYYSKKSIETMSDAYITFYENLLSIYGQIINSDQTFNTSKAIAKMEICDYYNKAKKSFPDKIENISIWGIADIKTICE